MHDTTLTTSPWVEGAGLPAIPPLERDTSADVCVVGAGIAGLTTAYLLARAGREVVVLERGALGSGETARTTAHLTCVLDMRYSRLEGLHGEDALRLAVGSHAAAIDLIQRIVERESIDCGFERVDGYLFAGSAPLGRAALEQELQAARRAGVAAELVPRAPLAAFDTGPALRFPRQGQLHPLRYLAGLARAVLGAGGAIYSGAHVVDVAGSPPEAATERGHRVRSGSVILATNTPGNDRVVIHAKQAPHRSYVIAGRVPRGQVEPALYWDGEDPYHYARVFREPDEGDDLLIVGGEDHKTGQADASDRFARLERWTRERFPSLASVRHRWAGQVQEPADGLGFIGRKPGDQKDVYVATGSSGNGMTYGTLAGVLLDDLLGGRDNPWAELYDPARLTLRAARELLEENLNVAAQYARHAAPPDVAAAEDVERGSGAIQQRGLHKLAVSRDSNGVLHALSAVCPHLGCIVKWNRVESSWDCPCHGSRFTPDGRILNGPALVGLGAAPEEA